MRELVHVIDTHVEMVDRKATSNLNATEDVQAQQLPTNQPTEEVPAQTDKGVVPSQPTNPTAWVWRCRLPFYHGFS